MTKIHTRVEAAQRGDVEAAVVCRVPSGWVVLGERQILPGYCLLLPDPVVPTLNDLKGRRRERFLLDMTAIGDALLAITGAVRINYSIYGNLEPALHAHIIPRYLDEPDPMRVQPVWLHDWSSAPPFDAEEHADLQHRLAEEIAQQIAPRA